MIASVRIIETAGAGWHAGRHSLPSPVAAARVKAEQADDTLGYDLPRCRFVERMSAYP